MTGYRSKSLRHKCESAGCYIAKLPCWDNMLTAVEFPRGIKPMDIDGFLEINGHYLFLEEKGRGVPLYQRGQGDALRMLARLPQVSVVIFRPAEAEGFRDVIVNEDGGAHAFATVSDEQFYAWLRRWVMRAESAKGDAA